MMKRISLLSIGLLLTLANSARAEMMYGPSAGGGGGGSVSITAGSTNIVVSPSPITGTGTVDTSASPAFGTSVTSPLIIGGTGATQTLTLESKSGAGTVAIGTQNAAFGMGVSGTVTTLTINNTTHFTPDFSTGNEFTITLTAACPCVLDNPTNTPSGTFTGTMNVIQGAGSNTLTYGTNWTFPGHVSPTLSTAAAARDQFSVHKFDATHIDLSLVGNNFN